MAELRYLSMVTSMNEHDVRDVWHLINNAQYERAYTEISDMYSRCCIIIHKLIPVPQSPFWEMPQLLLLFLLL